MSLRPSPADVETFRSLLTREVGLRFEDDKLPLLQELLASRAARSPSKTIEGYLASTASSTPELAALAPLLTVSETYFFRDANQFRALKTVLSKHPAAEPIRMLSAGCSSGEEPYSLAIAAREALPDVPQRLVQILGVDLNPEAIGRARQAQYTEWALRESSQQMRRKYFEQQAGRYRLNDSVRKSVRFEQQNLLSPQTELWRQHVLDIVFCRNVLMYLAPMAARVVVAKIARSLMPGGYLFLGHAENLRGLSFDFHLRHTHDTFYYQRKDATETSRATPRRAAAAPPTPQVLSDTSWCDDIARASSRIEHLSQDSAHTRDNGASGRTPAADASADNPLAPAMDLMKRERFHEALRLLTAVPSADTGSDALLLRATLLTSTGEVSHAETLCLEILQTEELNAGAHYILALCREHAGDREGAAEHSAAAAYLDPEFAMPRLQRGRMARRAGDLATARRELELALVLLSREDAGRILLFGGGFSREGLLQVCRGELDACGRAP